MLERTQQQPANSAPPPAVAPAAPEVGLAPAAWHRVTTAAGAAAGGAPASPGALGGASGLLALQRSIGNQAVLRLLGASASSASSASSAVLPAVPRAGPVLQRKFVRTTGPLPAPIGPTGGAGGGAGATFWCDDLRPTELWVEAGSNSAMTRVTLLPHARAGGAIIVAQDITTGEWHRDALAGLPVQGPPPSASSALAAATATIAATTPTTVSGVGAASTTATTTASASTFSAGVRVNATGPPEPGGGPPSFAPGTIQVVSVDASNQRVPTELAGGRQGRHTVAFGLLLRALAGMGGRTAESAIRMIEHRVAAIGPFLESPTAIRVSRAMGAELRASRDPATVVEWQGRLGDLIKHYVELYHLSSIAAFPSSKPKGKGEGSRLATLSRFDGAAKAGSRLTPAEVVAATEAASGLLDLTLSRSAAVTTAIFVTTMEELRTAFPSLCATYPVVFDGILDRPLSTTVIDSFNDREPAPAVLLADGDQIRDLLRLSGHLLDGSAGLHPAAAAVSVVATAVRPPVAKKAAAFRSGVRVGPVATTTSSAGATTGAVGAGQVEIVEVTLTNVRPPTRFLGQNSHTVAYSLLQRELASYAGKTAAAFVAVLQAELASLRADLAPEDAALLSSGGLTTIDLTPRTFTDWQADLTAAVHQMVEVHHRSRSAIYVDSRTNLGDPGISNRSVNRATGKAEPTHLKRLKGEEDGAFGGAALGVDLALLAKSAIVFLDVSCSLPPVYCRRAFHRWMTATASAYPTLWGRYGATFVEAALLKEVGNLTSIELGAYAAQSSLPGAWMPISADNIDDVDPSEDWDVPLAPLISAAPGRRDMAAARGAATAKPVRKAAAKKAAPTTAATARGTKRGRAGPAAATATSVTAATAGGGATGSTASGPGSATVASGGPAAAAAGTRRGAKRGRRAGQPDVHGTAPTAT